MHQLRTGAAGSRSPHMRWVGWAAVVGLLVAAFAAPGTASSNDTPGNNGTVKIHEGGTETEPGPQNEPHVCTFHLHFFFADPVQAGNWEIQEWSPGDKGTVVLTGTYDTAGDGEDRDPDEPGVYELPDGHYKLFWDGDLDTDKHDKHKVFWVDCLETAPPTFEQSVGTETESPPPPPETESVAPAETESPAPSFEQSVAPETEAPSASMPAESVAPSFEQSAAPETEMPSAPPETESAAPSFEQSVAPETEAPSMPAETASAAPTAEQSVGAETSAPTPEQSVAADTDVPAARTQPPTDTVGTSGPNDDGWRWLFVMIAGLLATVLAITPKIRGTAPTHR
jgi:hypothetical protein